MGFGFVRYRRMAMGRQWLHVRGVIWSQQSAMFFSENWWLPDLLQYIISNSGDLWA